MVNGKSIAGAVIVVDMQEYYLELVRQKAREPLIRAHENILRHCAQTNTPVVYLEYAGFGNTIERLRHNSLGITNYGIVRKRHLNGFRELELARMLKLWEVSNVYLTGVFSNACVQSTAKGAIKEGFRVLVSKDAIAEDAVIKNDFRWFKRNAEFYEEHGRALEKIAVSESVKD